MLQIAPNIKIFWQRFVEINVKIGWGIEALINLLIKQVITLSAVPYISEIM